jgi:hypothetical protein
MSKNLNTREEWLEAAVEELRPLFKGAGYDIPKVRVTCGWPSSKGLARKKKAIGECWDAKATEDGVAQIFISPVLNNDTLVSEKGVLEVLVHELVHAVVGCEAGHRKPFSNCADAVGLEKPWTATTATPELIARFESLVADKLGKYPHAAIVPIVREKTQSTRMIKAECADCGYTVRVTRKWIEVGNPHCPLHGEMDVENPEEGGTDED